MFNLPLANRATISKIRSEEFERCDVSVIFGRVNTVREDSGTGFDDGINAL